MSLSFQVEQLEEADDTTTGNSNRRQLVHPSKHIQWNIQVVSLVPQGVFDVLEKIGQQQFQQQNTINTPINNTKIDCGSITNDCSWKSFILNNGNIYVWPVRSTSTLSQELYPSTIEHILYAPPPPPSSPGDIIVGGSSSSESAPQKKMLIAMSNNTSTMTSSSMSSNSTLTSPTASSSSSSSFVYVYATHPDGMLYMWKLSSTSSSNQEQQQQQPHAKLNITQHLFDDETITSLSASSPCCLIIGTSHGRMFYCTQTVRPIMIMAQLMETTSSSLVSSTASSLYGVIFGTTPSKSSSRSSTRTRTTRRISSSRSQAEYEDSIHTILPIIMSSSTNNQSSSSSTNMTSSLSLLSITNSGIINHWTVVSSIADSHKSTFHMTPIISSLKDIIQEHLEQQSNDNERSGVVVDVVSDINVLRCTISNNNTNKQQQQDSSSNHYSINIIVRIDNNNSDNNGESSKLYWIQGLLDADDDDNNNEVGQTPSVNFSLVDIIWINRFHSPINISCIGLCTTNENITYAAFQYNSNNNDEQQYPVTVMALADNNSSIINEVDLPLIQVPKLIEGTMGNDIITHGWIGLASSGLGLRGCYTGRDTTEQNLLVTPTNKKRRISSSSSVVNNNLTSHLRSAFWHWYQHSSGTTTTTPTLPPSLTSASIDELEPAIITAATQLQHEGGGGIATNIGGGGSSNPMECHLAFIDLLQRGGLYRSISLQGRYALLGIGQELAVYQCLIKIKNSEQQQQQQQEQQQTPLLSQELHYIKPYNIVDWLQNIQDRVLTVDVDVSSIITNNKDDINLWCSWLSTVLETATLYRQDQSVNVYDVPSSSSSLSLSAARLWTCHPTLQNIMMKQLNFWNDLNDNINPVWLETVVKVSLISYMETTAKGSGSGGGGGATYSDDEREEQYDVIKQLGIPLVQEKLDNGSAVAFELSVDHHWFHGICHIAFENECYKDFELESILQNVDHLKDDSDVDYQTKLTFSQYVLKWHADRGLYAHVLKLGRFCPQDVLSTFLQGDDRLQRYQWIPYIQNHQYEDAAQHLLFNIECPSVSGFADDDLKSSQWELSLAKLSNKLAQTTATTTTAAATNQRQKTITNKLELAQAQEMLLERTNMSNLKKGLLSPDRLLTIAMDQLDVIQDSSSSAIDDGAESSSVQFCLIGLAICRSIEDSSIRMRMASQVWAKCLLVDLRTWMDLIQQQSTTTTTMMNSMLQTTVFGQVLEQYNANTSTEEDVDDDVAYNFRIENDVIARLGLDNETNKEMKRILRIGIDEQF